MDFPYSRSGLTSFSRRRPPGWDAFLPAVPKVGDADVENVPLADVTLLSKVRIALSEKHIAWEPIHVNLRANEHKPPEFLDLNPYGKVPVLLVQGAVIYESTVVNEYLEDHFPDPPLMPHDPLGRAEVRLWEDYGDNAFLGPAEGIFVQDKGWRTFESERLQQMRQQIRDVLTRVEQHLEGKKFLVHDTFSLADTALPYVLRF